MTDAGYNGRSIAVGMQLLVPVKCMSARYALPAWLTKAISATIRTNLP